jgi:bifunctional non-homologous end joining protein LigD
MSKSDRVETEVEGRRLSLSHLDKVLFPETGFTKGQLIDYYARIAPVMLPHLGDRPVTLRRFPDGVDGQSFFEKHAPSHAPDWVRTVNVHSTANGHPDVEFAVLSDLPSLVWAANLASIELHVPLWHVGRRRKLPAPPDHLVFDLDPGPGTSVVECCRVAGWIAEDSKSEGLEAYPKTSGSKGLQLYLPLPGRPTWDGVGKRAHDLALRLEGEHPDLVVSSMRKTERQGKVLIDWSQNNAAKTTVTAYSVRARPEPTVSTPVTWDEVHGCADSRDPSDLRFTTDQVLARVEAHGDLFAPVAT